MNQVLKRSSPQTKTGLSQQVPGELSLDPKYLPHPEPMPEAPPTLTSVTPGVLRQPYGRGGKSRGGGGGRGRGGRKSGGGEHVPIASAYFPNS